MGVVNEIAWPEALPTQIGIIIASLSQALQCLISAPRVLNAIAVDGTVPFLARAAFVDEKGEPVAALFATVAFCLCASMIGSLDLVAPLLSICFLAAYAALNFSTFALGLTKAPSWRPTWRYFHWSVGLAGFLLCTTLAFIIRWYFALVAVALLGALVAYIETAQVRVDWGSALGGIRLDLATAAMLDLAHERKHSSNWRPQLLCLPSWPLVSTNARSPAKAWTPRDERRTRATTAGDYSSRRIRRTTRCFETLNTNDDGTTRSAPVVRVAAQERARSVRGG